MEREELHLWCQQIEEKRPQINAWAYDLQRYGAAVSRTKHRIVSSVGFLAEFLAQGDRAVVRIWFQFMDDQRKTADIVITNMTILPQENCHKGHGSVALKIFLDWAKKSGFTEVCATQVGPVGFWSKNGFVRYAEPNSCNDFVFAISQPTTS
ncbi:MAG: hypothetical protein ABIP54_04615 [Candidatus Andersenbacteria bacterium]